MVCLSCVHYDTAPWQFRVIGLAEGSNILNPPFAGNYRGYYGKRRLGQDPYQGDERLKLIPKEWMQDQAVLDIGCNAGGVTIEIGKDGPTRQPFYQ